MTNFKIIDQSDLKAAAGTGAIILALGVKGNILGAERGAGNYNTISF
jgi:hypothetical protein